MFYSILTVNVGYALNPALQVNDHPMRPNLTDVVIVGDAVDVLQSFEDSSVMLLYLDPPFLTQREFVIISGRRTKSAFNDKWEGGLAQYRAWMQALLVEGRRVMHDEGSIYVHVDPRVSHYVKIMLDEIFGRANFRNEIVWKRQTSHNDTYQGARFFGRIHDIILFYTRSSRYKWNRPFVPYDAVYVRKKYRFVEPETNRRYALGDLTGPGGPNKGNARYEFLGVIRYWRYSKERMLDLLNNGRIVQKKPGSVPLLKRYLDEMLGKPVQDIWDDINLARGAESTGYPTQKPVKLLERLVYVSTDPGDLVVDPGCGSGSTLVAAHKLGRRWIGIDSSENACKIAMARLRNSGAEPICVDYDREGTSKIRQPARV